jgi:glyoxylase I family protein
MASPPFSLRKLDHVVLRVIDLKASLDFYVGVLGCAMEKSRPTLASIRCARVTR